MAREFQVAVVHGAEAAEAYPLVRALSAEIGLEDWLRFAAARDAAEGEEAEIPSAGLAGLRGEQGYLHAVCSYAVTEDLRCGRCLSVDNLVALDLLDSTAAAAALAGAMEDFARRLGCQAVHLRLPSAGAEGAGGLTRLHAALRQAGHRVDSLLYCKVL